MVHLENDFLKISIKIRGAELSGLFNKQSGIEHMWNADPAFWGRSSPVLFPIVGSLKNNEYFFDDKTYKLSRHGFAREMDFIVSRQTDNSVVFTLESNETTRANYPFDFIFEIHFLLVESQLSVTYHIRNTSDRNMIFAVGAHPAFRIPFESGIHYKDHFLEFEKKETEGRWPISADGLIEKHEVPLLTDSDTLQISKDLFANDAIVFKNLQSDTITLRSYKSDHGLKLSFPGFPYLGLWAATRADFVCIEPWCGIADSIDANQELTTKEGMNDLEPGSAFERSWTVSIF